MRFSSLALTASVASCLAITIGQTAEAGTIAVDTADLQAEDLVEELLGSGVTVVGVPTFTGNAEASSVFVNGMAAGIGIDSGIILSTGYAFDATGPNIDGNTSTVFDLPGDSDLEVVLGNTGGEVQLTRDAAVLEFDFTTDTGEIFFNFVFASEEYNEYVNTVFNDVFGFFVDGTNIALIPGTHTPISINTVNGGRPLGVDASNPELFNNNDAGEFDIEFDGFTDVFYSVCVGP